MFNPRIILLAIALVLPVFAKTELSPLFTDGAVLQRDKPVPI